jgi:nanoRNase/pAp phosphatase (c-di-AMP/oligoRNAs hydrolase)
MRGSLVRQVEIPPGLGDLVRSDPLVVAAVVVAALAVLAGLVRLRRASRSTSEQLTSALADVDAVSVLMHPNPDPDAMACALAVGCLAERQGTEATLQHPGEIRHQENRAFETVLDLDLERVKSTADLAAEAVVLVDHCTPRGFDGADSVLPYAVIDHHPHDATGAAFVDVRPQAGACSSIVTGYLRDLGLEPTPTTEEPGSGDFPSRIATGLLYGIHADTKGLTRGCSAIEFEACTYLDPAVDADAFDRIANPQIAADVLGTKARAITDREVRGTFAVSNVGHVDSVDGIPQAAEELLRLEGVSAVVVTGEHDGTLHVSGRSRDDRVHMGKCISRVIEEFPGGSAGGHARMGGGQLPLESTPGAGGPTVTVLELTDDFFDALSGAR